MKTKTLSCVLAAVLAVAAGCGDRAARQTGSTDTSGGRLFGVSFQTMNNPFFVDLTVFDARIGTSGLDVWECMCTALIAEQQ